MRPDLDARLTAVEAVRVRELGDGAVVLHLETSRIYTLDATAARMWMAIAEGDTLRDARDSLLSIFEVAPERLEKDLLELAERMLTLGLLRRARQEGGAS